MRLSHSPTASPTTAQADSSCIPVSKSPQGGSIARVWPGPLLPLWQSPWVTSRKVFYKMLNEGEPPRWVPSLGLMRVLFPRA